MAFDAQKFAEKLNKCMSLRNMTGCELAEITGISTVTISKYRTGKGKPRVDSVYMISKALDVDVFELLDP